MMFTSPKRLRAIFSELGFDELTPDNCVIVADKLNKYNVRGEWSGSYIRNIMQGKQKASRFIIPAIMKLTITPVEYPPRTTIIWPDTPEGRKNKELVGKLSMETRRKIFIDYINELSI